LSTIAAVVLGAALLFPHASQAKKKPKAPERPLQAEDLEIVDCLLPGQVRSLGTGKTYVSRRRPVRTTADICAIRGGEYVASDRANFSTALRIWLEAAEAGDAEAQYYVGEIYEKGLGTEPDYAKAAEWYRRSAEQGYARAQTNLGFLYEQGLGVEADPRQALEWYRQASNLSYVIMLDSELDELQKNLADTTARLKTLETSLHDLQAELDASERELRAAKTSGQTSAGRVAELEANAKSLRGQIKTQQQEIATLNDEQQHQAQRPADAPAVAGPSIEVFDASELRTRSRETPVTDRRKLVGRVSAPAGLAQFRIDDVNHEILERGLFEFELPADHAGAVHFMAVDKQGKTTEIEFVVSGADGAGRVVRPAIDDVPTRGFKLGTYHALVIGDADYSALPDLETSINDARSVAKVLQDKYGYDVTLLTDATRVEILSAFKRMMDGLTDKDNLLIYYAGHGELDARQRNKGYWLPVDADKVDRGNWISSTEISDYLSIMRARQVLVIADSCYSGALTASSLARFEGTTAKERVDWLKSIAGKRVRVALTSGGLKPVLDSAGGEHSVFAGAILNVLSENTGALETARLWSAVSARVAHVSETLQYEQKPQYAPIRYAGHESGEYVFLPPR
jgi:uncharacterized caspase-like protein